MKTSAFFLVLVGLASALWAAESKQPAEAASVARAPALVDLKSAKITFIGEGSALISSTGQTVKLGDSLAEKTDMETGSVPVTEVTFEDGSVMRLGEKTKVSYSAKERVVRISQGTVLFHSPSGHGGITLQGAQGSGQVAGSTVMGTQDSSGSFSFLLLESSGAGSVTGGPAGTTVIGVGEMTTIRANAAQAPEVVEVHVDAVRDISPLFQQISTPLASSPQVVGTTEQQAMEIQTDIKFLSSLDDFKLTEADPEGVALAMICGVGQNEMGAAKNILLRPVDTAAGTEAGADQGSVLAVGGASFPVDARQAEAEPLVAATSLPSSGDGLGSTDTAAGGGDLGATDTAAGGGGGGADTQAPASLPAPITSSPNPGLTTPI